MNRRVETGPLIGGEQGGQLGVGGFDDPQRCFHGVGDQLDRGAIGCGDEGRSEVGVPVQDGRGRVA